MKTMIALLFALPLLAQQQAPLQVPDTVILDRDIDYAPKFGGKLGMDVARPKGDGPFPGVVMIHGGGFRAGQRQSYLAMAVRLAEHGYVAATVSYRLTPLYQFPSPVYDVKAAVRFLRANAGKFGLDVTRIGAMGGSAGGHLALFLGLTGGVAEFEGDGANPEQSSRVSCVVNYYGPSDFTRIYDKGGDAAQVLPQFLGGDIKHAMAAHIKASPLQWVSPDDAPILSIHGTKDPLVPYEQSVWLAERLLGAGVEAELETLSGAGHGFRGADAERAEKRALAWFDKHLKKPLGGKQLIISNHGRKGEIIALDWPTGKVLWHVPNDSGHDVQVLPNGHVLFTKDPSGVVVEIDEKQKEVWTYSEGLKKPVSAQRLANGNTVIGDMVLGKVVEVTPAGKVVWSYSNPEMGESRMRLSRRTAAGTTLISIERMGKIIEVDQAGKIVWTFQTEAARKPYLAQRLPNGNTLVSMAEPGEAVEVDRNGKTVRSVGSDGRVRMAWASGIHVTPEGTMYISDYLGKRLLEVNAKGDLVHELSIPWSVASVTAP